MTDAPNTHSRKKMHAKWMPTKATIAVVQRDFPKVDHQRSHERFVSFHLGKGDYSESWDAAFRLWVAQDDDKIENHLEGGTDYRGVPNDSKKSWDNYLMGRTEGTQP